MEIEHHIRGIDDGTHGAGAVELEGAAGAVERRRIPDAVEILVDEARSRRVLGVETVEGCEIGESRREPPAAKYRRLTQEPVESDRAPELVTVNEGETQHVRPG